MFRVLFKNVCENIVDKASSSMIIIKRPYFNNYGMSTH
jgi:hypothetical protein